MTIRNEIIIKEDSENIHHSLLIVVKDTTISARIALPVSMIDNILPYLPPSDLFIFITTINICQKSLKDESVVKAVVSYNRKISTEHANYVTTINSLNTISYLCAIIRTIYVPSPMRLLCLVNE